MTRDHGSGWGLFALMVGLVFAAIIIGVGVTGTEVIPAGYKGVMVNSPSGPETAEISEGWKWSASYVFADIENVEWRTQTVSFVGNDKGDDTSGSVQIITNDSVPMFLDFSITYHIQEDRVSDLAIENGLDYRERIIYPYARSIARDVASHYTALEIIGDKRGATEVAIGQGITTELSGKYIVVERFSMRDVRIPDNLERSIVAKKVAEQNVLTQQYNLFAQEYIANQTIVNAIANATSAAIRASGEANATVIKAQATAEAVQVVKLAVCSDGENATIGTNCTAEFLHYVYIQALTDPNGHVQFVMIPSEGGMPLILNPRPE